MAKRLQEVEINGDKWVLMNEGGLLPFVWYVDVPNYTAQDRNDGLVYRCGFATQEKAETWFRGEVSRS